MCSSGNLGEVQDKASTALSAKSSPVLSCLVSLKVSCLSSAGWVLLREVGSSLLLDCCAIIVCLEKNGFYPFSNPLCFLFQLPTSKLSATLDIHILAPSPTPPTCHGGMWCFTGSFHWTYLTSTILWLMLDLLYRIMVQWESFLIYCIDLSAGLPSAIWGEGSPHRFPHMT